MNKGTIRAHVAALQPHQVPKIGADALQDMRSEAAVPTPLRFIKIAVAELARELALHAGRTRDVKELDVLIENARAARHPSLPKPQQQQPYPRGGIFD